MIRVSIEPNGSSMISAETITIGILESLWHMASTSAPQGDIGKFSNEAIAEYIGWYLPADEIIKMLIETGWIDKSDHHRLIVHDWHEHCPKFIKGNLSKHKKAFAIDGPIKEIQRIPKSPHYSETRKRILQRDNYICQYCGGKADQIDHIKEQMKGADYDDENTISCCRMCNLNLQGKNFETKVVKQRAYKQRAIKEHAFTTLVPNPIQSDPIQSKNKKKICDIAVLGKDKQSETPNLIPTPFSLFWKYIPSRNGKKLGKQTTEKLFMKLEPDDQELAVVASKNYADSEMVKKRIGIRDPARFLHLADGSEPWRDWIEPEQAQSSKKDILADKNQQAIQDALAMGN